MPTTRYSTEQIVSKLRQAEVELSRGLRTPAVCKKLGVSEQTYDRWRKEYGGLRLDQAKRLKELERENTRLKKLVADRSSRTASPRTFAQTTGWSSRLRSCGTGWPPSTSRRCSSSRGVPGRTASSDSWKGSTPGLRGPVDSPFLPTVSPADEICDSEKPGSPDAIADAQFGILENEFAPATELETPCFQLEHN